MMTLEQLPPKGVKREQAILELGKDEANAELLFQLVNTEKGKYKTAAQKPWRIWSMPLLPHCGPSWSRVMDGQQYHVGCLFRLCIGADRPSYSEDSLQAAGTRGTQSRWI